MALMGSAFVPSSFAGSILFLEEVDERPYAVDRMLTTLHTAGVFDHIAGFVFGQCTSCAGSSTDFTWEQVVDMRVQPLRIPAFRGALIGHHLPAQFVLPIGAIVEIDATQGTITMLESAVA